MIPFNVPTVLGREFQYIEDALKRLKISGNGKYTELCHKYLARLVDGATPFLTTSCTDALEMASILAGFGPGDEVLMPSFTFTSTANAIVLRGATPVFVDIRSDTLNIDETKIEEALTDRTRGIMVVHYAGVGCEMDVVNAIAKRRGLVVIEDAAQALHAHYRGRPLGAIGDMGTYSFHETKNIISGEGGALLVTNPNYVARAEIIWEKGTNRVNFSRGEVPFYNWVDVGSSFLPSEITAAFLYAQLECSREATERRLAIWDVFAAELASLEYDGRLSLPHPPKHCQHNGHIFYLLAPDAAVRRDWLNGLGARGVNAVSHYVPLHSAPAGRRFGRTVHDLRVTDDISARLIRLPMHFALTDGDQAKIIEAVRAVVEIPDGKAPTQL